MSPLELEIYHQMRNVIGIDPTFYEYIFQVDADTVSFRFVSLEIAANDQTVMP
jgi:chitin synthase